MFLSILSIESIALIKCNFSFMIFITFNRLSLSLYHFRLLNTFAEENSIADAIFHLNDALKKEVIDLEIFLKVSSNAKCDLYQLIIKKFLFFIISMLESFRDDSSCYEL